MFEVFLTVLAIAIQTGSGAGHEVATAQTGQTGQKTVAQGGAQAVAEAAPKAAGQAEQPAATLGVSPSKPALVAEPQTPTGKFTTATEVKPILGATKANWIGVREFDGKDLLYVTQILTWRCGLLDLRLGINGAPPESWDMPPCHLDQPMPGVMLEGDGLPFRSFELGSVETVEVELIYDDLTSDRALFGRKDVLMP